MCTQKITVLVQTNIHSTTILLNSLLFIALVVCDLSLNVMTGIKNMVLAGEAERVLHKILV